MSRSTRCHPESILRKNEYDALKVGLHVRFFMRFFETISFVLEVAAKNRVESVETDSKRQNDKSRAIFYSF